MQRPGAVDLPSRRVIASASPQADSGAVRPALRLKVQASGFVVVKIGSVRFMDAIPYDRT